MSHSSEMEEQHWWQFVLLAFVLCCIAFVLARPIMLGASDLGRHITNGHLTLGQGIIPNTNLYSYVHPDFPFVNHHWASGVILAVIYDFVGFSGLSVASIALCMLTFFLLFDMAWMRGRFDVAILYSLLIVPILGTRPEVRPENFSYFLIAAYMWLLLEYRDGRISRHWLWSLVVLEALWTNLHIYFFIGCIVIGSFLLDEWIVRFKAKQPLLRAPLLPIFLLACCATVINPSGIWGALEPLLIFTNYNYPVAENQSILNIEASVPYMIGIYFKLACGVAVFAIVRSLVRWRSGRGQLWVSGILLLLLVMALAWTSLRHFALFGYVSVLLIPIMLKDLPAGLHKRSPTLMSAGTLAAAFLVFLLNWQYWVTLPRTAGIGLEPHALDALAFYKNAGIQGPLFNDYDIGGYLIFGLYPQQQVFTDNRPEAYPGEFFQNVYIPMQMNDLEWQKQLKKFGFTTIFLRRNDMAQWTKRFILARLQDKEWVPVFADNVALIFVRAVPQNARIIERYGINKAQLLQQQQQMR